LPTSGPRTAPRSSEQPIAIILPIRIMASIDTNTILLILITIRLVEFYAVSVANQLSLFIKVSTPTAMRSKSLPDNSPGDEWEMGFFSTMAIPYSIPLLSYCIPSAFPFMANQAHWCFGPLPEGHYPSLLLCRH